MEIRFWGVRGSVASPGETTQRTGGNTSCVEVRCGEQTVVLDAGTGLRRLGDSLLSAGTVEVTLLLSHLHWDHIQGIPFFAPLYVGSTRMQFVGAEPPRMTLRDALGHQMTDPVFPVRLDEVPSQLSYRRVRPGQSFALGDVTVRVARLNHPGGVLAYRIEHGGRSVVYATDTEHYRCLDPALVRLADQADVLIYDAQYTEAEYRGEVGPSRVGWGHSTWEAGVEVARAAGVGQLVLFHHDPGRSDPEVDAIEEFTRARFSHAVAAREGGEIRLAATPRQRAA